MAPVHRNNDPRVCGAVTVVTNQTTTFSEGELWAVEGDPNDHGEGGLIPSGSTVYIEGKLIIVHAPDAAAPDLLCIPLNGLHCEPATAGGSPKTYAYGG